MTSQFQLFDYKNMCKDIYSLCTRNNLSHSLPSTFTRLDPKTIREKFSSSFFLNGTYSSFLK